MSVSNLTPIPPTHTSIRLTPFLQYAMYSNALRAISSVGRAPALQAGCHRFKSCIAQKPPETGAFLFIVGGVDIVGFTEPFLNLPDCHCISRRVNADLGNLGFNDAIINHYC